MVHSEAATSCRIQGLYLLTRQSRDTTALIDTVSAAIRGGARVVQYRDKSGDTALRLTQALALKALCQPNGVLLLINDDVALAIEVGADGVHLGADDQALKAARAQLGPDAIIGRSCYNDPTLALKAVADGASYVAFGAFFSSATKPQARVAQLDLFAQTAQLNVPRVGIGGIDASNAMQLKAAGADAVAVLGAIWDSPNPESTARAITRIFA